MSITRRTAIRSGGALAGVIGLGSLAGCLGDSDEDEEYPSETIEYLVPAPPGGGIDSYARSFGPELGDRLDVPVTVSNEPGGGQWNAIGSLINDDADGYTIAGAILSGVIFNAIVEPPPVDIEDVGFVCGHGVEASMLVTNTDHAEFENDFEGAVEAFETGEYNQVAVVEGTMQYLLPEVFPVDPIGYPDSTTGVQAVLSDEVTFGVTSEQGAYDLVEEGSLVPVGNLSDERVDTFPDTPALVEDLGYESIHYGADLHRAIIVHDDTDDDRRDLLEETFEEIIDSEEMQQWAEDTGLGIEYVPSEEVEEYWDEAFEQLSQLVD